MAIKTIRMDDIDGTPDAESYSFALNGEQYDIDLSKDNFEKLQAALAPYVKVAAKATSRVPREASASTSRNSSNKEELQKIRQWAKDNGYEVSERGRVAQSIQDAYHAAN
jgi:hypothetical protein